MNDLIEQYLRSVLLINNKINLTNIRNFEEAKLLHIEDSLAVIKELNEAPKGLYGDMGSGGGFPGVPLGIISGRNTILIDSVKKKMAAINQILNDLGLSEHISVCDQRIEELSLEKKEEFSVLTARALSNLSSLLELASPLLKIGGRLICLKSHTDEELKSAKQIKKETGMSFLSKRSYILSDDKTYRECIVFEKVTQPAIQLPRRVGLAQKKPLISK
ncbi:16S rRNA (guanine(527)-N(7))-methyltransferase RsmG [Adlercreutzia sp. ZJ304]|uniref:16S rRNA (guanine(527)-N(7))-methyltransferase RsmG n=1 Tax=Adlercreutzia sp. ZJ304 TaxID=2709791 RepID=UPI0013EB6D4D|nr:16S rRNA (guanine(527)-N(7))-methyltransferase RsmG [Adlercreutzia sp. ZJ304]